MRGASNMWGGSLIFTTMRGSWTTNLCDSIEGGYLFFTSKNMDLFLKADFDEKFSRFAAKGQ